METAETIAPPPGFELDAQPAPPAGFVLDDTPAPPPGFTLDTAPPNPDGEWRAAPPKGMLTQLRESLSPLLGPTENQRLDRQRYQLEGADRINVEGFFPALSHPMIPLPRVTAPTPAVSPETASVANMMAGSDPTVPPETVAALMNTAKGFLEFLESPLGLATGGLGKAATLAEAPLVNRVIAGGYAGDMALKVPEAAAHAGEASVTGTPQEQMEAYLGLGTQVVLPGTLGGHALAPGRANVPVRPAEPQVSPTPKAKSFSEFGSEAEPSTVNPKPSTTPALEEVAAPSPAKPTNVTPLVGEQAPPTTSVQTTLPESADTLAGQLLKLHEGKAPAVLFTPEDAIPEWALKDDRFAVTETPAGRFVYDTAALTGDEIARAVAEDRIGDVLGYGTPRKPAGSAGVPPAVIVVRDRAGTELRAVVVDEASAPAALAAAQKYASAGDTISTETPEQVLSKRMEARAQTATPRTVDAEAQAAAYTQARREREAAAAAERQRLAAKQIVPDSTLNPEPSTSRVTDRHLEEAREAIEQANERPPDLLDELDDHAGTVKFPAADYADLIDAARERVAQERHAKPWAQLRREQRQAIDRQLRVSTSEGTPADQALRALAGDNPKYADWSIDDFANALLDAGEGRLTRKLDEAAVRSLAEEIAKAEQEPIAANNIIELRAALVEGKPLTGVFASDGNDVYYSPQEWNDPGYAITHPETAHKGTWIKTNRGFLGSVTREEVTAHREVAEMLGYHDVPGHPGEWMKAADLAKRTPEQIQAARKSVAEKQANEAAALERLEQFAKDSRKQWIEAIGRGEYVPIESAKTFKLEPELEKAGFTKGQYFYEKLNVTTWDEAALATLDSLKVDTNGQLHAFGLLPEAWNTLIEIAKAAVRGGRALGEAIDYAIAQIKARYPEAPLDEAGARAELAKAISGQRLRGTAERALQSPDLSPEVKTRIAAILYDPRNIANDQATARSIVSEIGEVEAMKVVNQWPAEIPSMVKVAIGGEILERNARREAEARTPGDRAIAVAVQAEVVKQLAERNTDPAQQLRMMQEILKASPDAQVERAKRDIEKTGDAELDRRRGEINQVRQAVNEGRAAGIEAVRHDPEVNAAAREAVNETIKASDETHRAVIMDLAGPWSQSEFILQHARDAVRAKADELLNRQPRPPGFTPAQHLRQILDDLASRAAGIFAGHIQGSEPGVLLVDKLKQRLGVDQPTAVKLASSLSKEWDAQLQKARKALDEKLAKARVRQERREREAESNAAVDRALRRQLRAQNLKLGEAIRQAQADRQASGRHMADKIVEASGLTGEKADALRARLQARYDALVAEAQRRALEAIENRTGVKTSKAVRTAFDRVIEIDRLSPGNPDAFLSAVRVALKLPTLTREQAAELRQMVLDAQAKPAGWQQQRALAKVLTYVEKSKGALGWRDVPMAIWYANIFSALPTHAANIIGNTFKAAEVIGLEILLHPTAAPGLLRAVARGTETGLLEAGSVLKTGSVEGTRLLKAEAAKPLEAKLSEGGWKRILYPWAMVSRALAAEDVVPFKSHEELKWQLTARRVAQQEGLRGEQLDARVDELLHNRRGEYEAAKVQAAGEGLTGLDLRRRAHEIIEQRREASLPGSTAAAQTYALTHTFNGEPYGVLGAVAEWLNSMNRTLVVTRFAVPVVRIVANLGNESLNYFPPVGLARVVVPKWRRSIIDRAAGDNEAVNYYIARAAVGTVLFGALATIGANSLNDDDPALAITGQGPRTKTQRDLLKSTGWKANAIKIGDRYYSYQETQLAIPLNALGNYFDALRYKNLDEQDALTRLAYVLQMSSHTILDQRMLSGLTDLLDVLHKDEPGQSGAALEKFLARAGSSFVVPNAARWVDQVFDPTVYDADDVKGALLQNIPFARRLNRPALNALGEPLERTATERFTTPAKPDALVTTLAQKNAWLPMPSLEEQVIGDPRLGPDYERPMTPEEYYDWIADTGPRIREQLERDLDKIAGLTDPEAQAYVRKVAQRIRREAKPRR